MTESPVLPQTASSATSGGSQDCCQTFMVQGGASRGRIVRLDQTLQDILGRHDYPPAVAHLLAEVTTLAVILAFSMKFDGVFTLQAQGDGAVRLLVADVTSAGAVRAWASFDAEAVAAIQQESPRSEALPRLLGQGCLAFTVDLAPTVLQGSPQRYQGIVPLEDATLADCVHRYFRQSEQLETAVKVETARQDADGRILSSCAVMVQRMPPVPDDLRSPEELDDLWRTTVALLGSLTGDEMVDRSLSFQTLLWRLFHQEELATAEPRPLQFGCRCSREKVMDALASFPPDDRLSMQDDSGAVVAHCQFCSTEYRFSPDDLTALASAPASEG